MDGRIKERGQASRLVLLACPLSVCREGDRLRLDDGVEVDLAVLDGEDGQGLDGVVKLIEGDLPGNAVEGDLLEGGLDGGVLGAGIRDGGEEEVRGVIGEDREGVRAPCRCRNRPCTQPHRL